jgi:predicted nucleic-acid-binding protein
MMLAAYTNIWARVYLNDDEVRARKARAAIEKACSNGGLFVPLVVLAELFWALAACPSVEVITTIDCLKSALIQRGVPEAFLRG